MLWPTPAEYAQAVGGFPDVSVLDLKFNGGKPKRDPTGLLLVYSGGFSTVFPMEVAPDTYALRCWTQDIGDAKDRYEKISNALKDVNLPYFVDFEYVPEGILINGKKYPITRMEWAEGETLRDFIKQNLQNARIFSAAADKFREMFETLHRHQISHGDLQDGNILLKRNGPDVSIKLIDYDSLYVPELLGQPSPTPGLPEYQHASRGTRSNEKVDYFSELVIYLSFLSLSEKPELWDQFKDKTERGLLFSREDFENPDQSDVFQELANLSSDVQELAKTLKDFCAKTSIDQLEPLEEILPKPDAKTYSKHGFDHLNNKRYSEALAEFQKAIAINPNYEEADLGIGLAYLHSKQYTNAINAFEQAIKNKPNYKEAHHGLGLAYFKSGDNSKATAAANAALGIDPHYQPARQLLDAIKSATSAPVPPPSPTGSTSTSTPAGSTSHPAPAQSAQRHWQSVTIATLGLALVICFVAFLTQMNAKEEVLSQNAVLRNQLAQKEIVIRQRESEIRRLTTSVQGLEIDRQKLNRANDELQTQLKNKRFTTATTSGEVVGLRRQLNEQRSKNQGLQAQLGKKDAEIRQLRNDKAVALNENRALQKRLLENKPGIANQSDRVQQLQREKTAVLNENRTLQKQLTEKSSEVRNLTTHVRRLKNENRTLQEENEDLTGQNRKLRNENTALRNQLGKAKQENSNKTINPEPPKKIRNYKGVVIRAGVYNNHGIIAFEREDYDKAITHFREAIKTDSKFAVAHYNLGCTYLEMKEYRDAISAFNKGINLNQRFKEAYYNRSLAYFRDNRFQVAKRDAEKALSINPNYQRARNLLKTIEKIQ